VKPSRAAFGPFLVVLANKAVIFVISLAESKCEALKISLCFPSEEKSLSEYPYI
jgi:hypothetical protein